MHWVLIGALLVIAVFCFFGGANHQTKRKHATFTKSDVIAAIEKVLADGDHDEWDLFLAWPIGDSYLESVRKRCIAISGGYSGTGKGRDIAIGGETKLLLILDELKTCV